MANYTKATNFTAKDALPAGNASKVVKGSEIDTEFTAISSAIASKADSNSPTFTGTPLAPTANTGTNNTQIATTAFVVSTIASALPSGSIIMWSGSIASIPNGWVLCNGSNGTPDLRNRFVVGAGSTYAVDGTGGSANATLVAHTHTGTTVSNGSHTHTWTSNAAFSTQDAPPENDVKSLVATPSEADLKIQSGTSLDDKDYLNDAGSHTHTFTTDSSGNSATNANLPPYYALAYIMKT